MLQATRALQLGRGTVRHPSAAFSLPQVQQRDQRPPQIVQILGPLSRSQTTVPPQSPWLAAASVETLAAYCGSPCLEAALAQLLPPHTLIQDVFLSQASSLVVPLRSGLTSMTYCQVSTPTGSIDLTPLQELTKLQKLHLSHGEFWAAGLPANLTNLTLEGAEVSIQHSPLGCSCVTSLRKLQVCHSYLQGLHPLGVLACSAVEHLQAVKSAITADEAEHLLMLADAVLEVAYLPSGMSALRSLSSLTVTFGNPKDPMAREDNVVHLGPLHALPQLQVLVVRSEGFSVDLWLPADLGALHNLTSLTLSAPVWDEHDILAFDHSDFPVAQINVAWRHMHALQCLKVHNWHFSCSSSILDLTTLTHLSEVTFVNCTLVDTPVPESSVKYFSCLMDNVVRHCPHVKLICEDVVAVQTDVQH